MDREVVVEFKGRLQSQPHLVERDETEAIVVMGDAIVCRLEIEVMRSDSAISVIAMNGEIGSMRGRRHDNDSAKDHTPYGVLAVY